MLGCINNAVFYCLLILSFTYLSYLQSQTVKLGYHKVFGECKIDPHLPSKRNTLFSCLTSATEQVNKCFTRFKKYITFFKLRFTLLFVGLVHNCQKRFKIISNAQKEGLLSLKCFPVNYVLSKSSKNKLFTQ